MSLISTIAKKLWPATIRGQLILGITLVHLLLMTIFVFDVVNRQRVFLQKQNQQQTFSFVNDYAVNAATYIIANDFDELEALTLSHANFPNLNYAMILSPEGVVLAHTNANFIGKRLTDDISLQLKGLTTRTILFENNHVLDVATPVFLDKKMVGWARAGVGQEYIQNNLGAIARNGIFYILIALFVGVCFAVLIGNRLTAGLYKLISTAGKIKAGDRNIRASLFKSFELRNLGTAFNQMLDEIGAKENLLSMVIENMPVGVWIFNEKGEVISGNSAGKEIWKGLRHVGINELGIYKTWNAATKKPIAPEQWAGARALNKGETTINEEIEIEIFDGTHKIILNSAIPLRGQNGNIIGAIAINVDITDRKKVNEQLALSESTFRSAFDYSAIGLALVSPNGEFLRVNKELCRMFGYAEQECLSLSFQDITFPEDLEENLENVRKTLDGMIDSYRMEKRYFHKNGTVIWGHLTVSLVRDSQNKPLFFVSQIEDISKRKKTEERIQESEEKFRKLVEESLVGVFILQDGHFVYVNPQFERITGYAKATLLNGMTFGNLIQNDDQEITWKNYLSGMRQETHSGHYLLKAIRKNGAVLQIETILSSIVYAGKAAVLGSIIDITQQIEEEKRMNKAATDAQEKERQQISMELHDNVKQLMAGCLLNIDFLKMIAKDEKTDTIINNIKNYIREAIEELRRISHQLAPSVDETIPFEEKIKTVVSTMNVSNAIEIIYCFDTFEEVIKADVQLAMYRIVQEQFTNILKHAKATLVEIAVQRQNGALCLSIKDNGIGFDPYSAKNGIGLENIKRRVQVFNGNFSIQTLPGKGCRLSVQFPVS